MEYWDSGDGEPIVLLNGIFMDCRSWTAFVEDFSRLFRVVAFDFPNQGKNIANPEYLSVAEYADCVKCVVDALALKERDVILVGMSFGGLVAYTVSELRKSVFREVIYVSFSPFIGPKVETNQQYLLRLLEERRLREFGEYYFSNWIYSAQFRAAEPEIIERSVRTFVEKYRDHPMAAYYLVKASIEFHESRVAGCEVKNRPFSNKMSVVAAVQDAIVDHSRLKAEAERHAVPVFSIDGGHALMVEKQFELFRAIDEILSRA